MWDNLSHNGREVLMPIATGCSGCTSNRVKDALRLG